MKKGRIIFLKIFLLSVLLFFQGISAHSYIDKQQHYLEISHDSDNIESRLTADNDSQDEDQIDYSDNSDLSEHPECQVYVFSALPLPNILFFSVWQPPKVF